ncbi:hypothetical protein OSB04_011908 [Centaurea solstitialis]|uniref:Uncharacterized protein n=1 Tax=Centaurea solstitialis TaxID=347529 RepID=A0AA38TAC4_9ASTR|nr:hypothetical protein OSB04_011908 [Centaurea solstitialis]
MVAVVFLVFAMAGHHRSTASIRRIGGGDVVGDRNRRQRRLMVAALPLPSSSCAAGDGGDASALLSPPERSDGGDTVTEERRRPWISEPVGVPEVEDFCHLGLRPSFVLAHKTTLMSYSVIPFYTPEESLRLINGKWKLTGHNFPVWKMHLDNILRAQGKFYVLEKPVSRPKSNSPDEEFTQYFKYMADESDVMSILIFSISSEFADRLRDKSCHEVMKDIESQLGFYRHTCKLLIMKEILSLKLKKDQSVKDHLMEMRRLFKCLTRLGYKMTQEELVYLMWYSLPKEIGDTASAYMKEPKTDVAALHEKFWLV